LEGDDHVVPFGEDGSPNAFLPTEDEDKVTFNGLPIVKRSLLRYEEIHQFLKNDLGLTPPDIADFVIQKVLPKYTPTAKGICVEFWENHFLKIRRALQTDSYEKRERLEAALQDAQFLLVVPADNPTQNYFTKIEYTYLNTDDLKLFFSGCENVYLLAPGKYKEIDFKVLVGLGVADSPRVKKRTPNSQGHVKVYERHGVHKRGLDGFGPDWQMDGLEQSLFNPTFERSRLLWTYLLPHSQCIRGVVEKSSRQTFENSEREHTTSNPGRLLMEATWLPDLAEKLCMKKPEHQQALELLVEGNPRKQKLLETLLSADDALLERFEKVMPTQRPPVAFKSFREGIHSLHRPQREASDEHPQPPSGVKNADRYQGKLNAETQEAVADAKTQPRTLRFNLVRAQSSNSEARAFLYEQYAGRCQVSGQTFVKADGNNYFEAVSFVSRMDTEHLNHPGNMLCLSAETSAKFCHGSFEWIEDLERKIQEFKTEKDGGSIVNRQIRIQLVGQDVTITWTEQHFMRLISLWGHA
jgi:hypothetical protein